MHLFLVCQSVKIIEATRTPIRKNYEDKVCNITSNAQYVYICIV